MSKIGEAMRRERDLCEASQTDIAHDAGFSRVHLANIEAGRYLPSVDALVAFANQFADVDLAEWLWLLLADQWGEPIADLMRRHVVAVAPRRTGSGAPGGAL